MPGIAWEMLSCNGFGMLDMKFELLSESIHLLPQKALFFPTWKTLILADLHLGKINHFRKSGIPVPDAANDNNTLRLIESMEQTRPDRVIFLGDLFHSHYNYEWEVMGQIRQHFRHVAFDLVLGNHDILSEQQYSRHQMNVLDSIHLGPFLLTHEPMSESEGGVYNIAGHIHPGVRLMGTARQSITLPCFYFGKNQALLPAFGSFTGLAKIYPKKDDRIFAIAENKIMELTYA